MNQRSARPAPLRWRRLFQLLFVAAVLAVSIGLDRRRPAWLLEDPLARPFGFERWALDALADPSARDARPEPTLPPQPVHLQTATEEDLVRLKGVGPVTARRILALRDSLGTIAQVEQLRAVRGIGPRRLEELRPWIRVGAAEDSTAASAPLVP